MLCYKTLSIAEMLSGHAPEVSLKGRRGTVDCLLASNYKPT